MPVFGICDTESPGLCKQETFEVATFLLPLKNSLRVHYTPKFGTITLYHICGMVKYNIHITISTVPYRTVLHLLYTGYCLTIANALDV